LTEQEHPLEYLPELALGVLAEDEAPGIRAHLESCESCRAEYEIMAEAARLLPYAVEEVEPAPSVKAGLMERIASEPRPLGARIVRPAWQRFTAIAAAAAVLVAVGGLAGAMLFGVSDGDLEDENGRQGALVRAVAEGNARRDTFEDGAMRANVVYAPGADSAFALLAGMPELPSGKAYQAWFIADGAPRPSNVFSSVEDGVWLESPGSVTGFAAMALTIEDEEGADAPSQAPFMVVELNATAGTFSLEDWFALSMD
jgi:anti-sigma-K factor RskA